MTALSINSCITDTSVVLQISNSVLSSTYLYNGTIDSRSLTYNKKHFGPDNVTCGTPPLGLPDLEQLLPIITFWLRSRRKECYARVSGEHNPILKNVCVRTRLSYIQKHIVLSLSVYANESKDSADDGRRFSLDQMKALLSTM